MYKIGEFSKITSLSVKTLRYYNEIGLLDPALVEESTGYRYYDQQNYETALMIKTLKRFEFSISELLEVVPKIENSEDLGVYLLEKHDQITERIHAYRKLQSELLKETQHLKEMRVMNQELVVKVKEIPEVQVAALRYKGKYEDVGIYLGQLFKVVGMHGSGVPFCLYYDEDYTEENADIEVAVPVKKELNKGDVSTRVLPAQKCVSLLHVGPYERLHESYKVIMDYIKEHELEAMTPSREIYMKGPGMLMKGNPEKYETEILIPVK